MAISAVNQAQQSGGTQPAGKSMGRDDFLKLLVAQLQNQDPLKPLDNQEFAAQLATFNSLDQLIGINQKLDDLQSQQQLAGQLGAVSLIGKEIVAEGNQVALAPGAPAPVNFALSGAAARVTVTIADAAGKIVRTLDLGGQDAGERSVLWDGKDGAGKALPAGVYSIQASALDAAGNRVGATSRTRGIVTGLSLEGGVLMLQVGALTVPLAAVKGVL
ncbi:MAG TPA: flagellar hook capping FlgD N-terminal domain-containing protein [Candidatus Binatia bacterium]